MRTGRLIAKRIVVLGYCPSECPSPGRTHRYGIRNVPCAMAFPGRPGRVRGLPGERGDLAAAQQPTQLDLSR